MTTFDSRTGTRRLTPGEVAEVLRLDPARPLERGQLRFLARIVEPSSHDAKLLDAVLEGATTRDLPPAHEHPAQRMRPMKLDRLSGSDLAWLGRLGEDPAKVATRDVTTLVSMRAAVTDEADKRLLDSILEPVKAHHDLRAIEASSRRILADNPPRQRNRRAEEMATEALAEHHQASIPGLDIGEALGRGRAQVAEVLPALNAERATARADAEAMLNRSPLPPAA